MKKILNNVKKYWLCYFIILQPIIDIAAYFQFKIFGSSYSWIIRLVLLISISLIVLKNSKNKKKLILKLSPFGLFLFLHLLNLYRINSISIISDIKYYILVMQMPILTILLIDYLKNNISDIKIIKKTMAWNFIIIALSMFLAYITGTYENTYTNIGILGWFTGSNTPSMILCALAPWALFYFSNSKNKIIYFFVSLIVFITLYVNATRACYITLVSSFIVIIFCTIISKERRKNIINIIIPCTFLCFSFILYNFSFTIVKQGSANSVEKDNIEDIRLAIEKDLNDEKYKNINFNKIDTLNDDEILKILNISYIYKDLIKIHGEKPVINAMRYKLSAKSLSDNRLRKAINAKIYFDESDTITKLLGIGYTIINNDNLDLENDLKAIFYYYGYIGFAIYIIFVFYFIFRLLKMFIKNISIIKDSEYVILVYLILLLIAGGEYSGAFLRKPNANIYLSLLFVITFFKQLYDSKNINTVKDDKITILALHLGTGGVEKYLSSLSNMLIKDYKIEIICTYKIDEKPAFYFDDKIKIKYLINDKPYKNEMKNALKNKKINSSIKYLFKNIKILFQKQFLNIREIEKIDSKYIITTRYFHNKLVSKYLDGNHIKIATEHNFHNDDKKYVKKLINSCSNIDYLVLVSEELKDYYKPKLKNTKCVYIPNVIDKLPKKRNIKINNTLVSVGRFSKEKGFIDLVDVINIVKNKIPSIKLYLIGDGEEKEYIEEKINFLNLKDNIILCGFCNSNEVEEYMNKANIYLMSSYTESFGIVLIEAMSHSLPCIAFDSANGAKNLLNNDNGILIPNRDKNLMAEKIIKLLKDNNYINIISNNGYIYCQQFLAKNIKNKWLNLLK